MIRNRPPGALTLDALRPNSRPDRQQRRVAVPGEDFGEPLGGSCAPDGGKLGGAAEASKAKERPQALLFEHYQP